ncbi:MAG: GtrA family protein [Burkholderiales bacterium]
MVKLAHKGSVAASTLGAVCGAVVNFALNHRFTFRSDRPHAHAAPRFLAVRALDSRSTRPSSRRAPRPACYLVAQVVATGAVLLTAFTVNRRWTFWPPPDPTIRTPRPLRARGCAGSSGRLVAVALVARIATLGLYPLMDNTEARYAEVARKMSRPATG